jgi:hypothetical protein
VNFNSDLIWDAGRWPTFLNSTWASSSPRVVVEIPPGRALTYARCKTRASCIWRLPTKTSPAVTNTRRPANTALQSSDQSIDFAFRVLLRGRERQQQSDGLGPASFTPASTSILAWGASRTARRRPRAAPRGALLLGRALPAAAAGQTRCRSRAPFESSGAKKPRMNGAEFRRNVERPHMRNDRQTGD